MIEPPRLGRGYPLVRRSQLALEVALAAYALVGALLTVRLVFLIIGVGDRVWSGALLYRLTRPFARPLSLIPGSGIEVVGDASLADVTLVGVVVLVPLAMLARGDRGG